MRTIEEVVAEMADREAIRDLPTRYCDYVWRGDFDGIVELFTEDGSFIAPRHGQDVVTQGREALRKMYREGPGFTPRPYVHNHVITSLADGRASGRCYTEIRDADRNMDWAGAVWYADEYVKVGDAWKFASRHVTVVRIDRGVRARLSTVRKPRQRKKAALSKRPRRR